MIAEKVLSSYKNLIKFHCIRPATVCGYSPKMRLDLSVNLFTIQALKNKELTVFGGNQIRPNIHIQDLVDVYIHFIKNPNLPNGFYNAGFENLKIIDIAKKVSEIIPSKIKIQQNNSDLRSYRQNSDKLILTGFKKNFSISNAIVDLKKKYEEKKFFETDECYIVRSIKKLNIK